MSITKRGEVDTLFPPSRINPRIGRSLRHSFKLGLRRAGSLSAPPKADCTLTRAAPGSKESKLWRQRMALHMGSAFSQHTFPSAWWRAEARAGLIARGGALPPRACGL